MLCSVVEKQSFHCLPSDHSVRNFIFNEETDHVSKNLIHCSLNFTADLFTNKAQFDAGFSKRLKLEDDAVPTILYPTVMSQYTSVSVNVSFYY